MIVLKNKKINRNTISAFFIILLIPLIASCTKRPDDILSRRDMQDILLDLHKTDGVLNALAIPQRNTEERQIYYQTVLEYHHTNQAQFDSSVVWYTAHPKKFEKIYLHVLTQIEKELAQLNIADIPLNVELPDAHYWKQLGNLELQKFPECMQRSLYIILNQPKEAIQISKSTFELLPYPNKKTNSPTKVSTIPPRKFITAQSEHKQ